MMHQRRGNTAVSTRDHVNASSGITLRTSRRDVAEASRLGPMAAQAGLAAQSPTPRGATAADPPRGTTDGSQACRKRARRVARTGPARCAASTRAAAAGSLAHASVESRRSDAPASRCLASPKGARVVLGRAPWASSAVQRRDSVGGRTGSSPPSDPVRSSRRWRASTAGAGGLRKRPMGFSPPSYPPCSSRRRRASRVSAGDRGEPRPTSRAAAASAAVLARAASVVLASRARARAPARAREGDCLQQTAPLLWSLRSKGVTT